MGQNPGYLTLGETPLERVHRLLLKLDSTRVSKDMGSQVSTASDDLFHNIVESVASIFKNLPNPLKWQYFLVHDLSIVTDIPLKVQDVSVKHRLNKAQTKALAMFEQVSFKAFEQITQNGFIPFKRQNHRPLPRLLLKDASAREIQTFAEDLKKTIAETKQTDDIAPCKIVLHVKVAVMTRLGIPQVRMARRLNCSRKALARDIHKTRDLFQQIYQEGINGAGIPDMARKYGVPQALAWSVVLQEKTDLERFRQLNWGLRTWDNWYFNDVDQRFGDDWPGRIPAQLVAHTLFYFTRQNDLVLDPMAGGAVVPDVCLAFNRRCWSFDLVDRPDTRPEIEPFIWGPKTPAWPVAGGNKLDLIFLDPPYFKKMAGHYTKGSISDLSQARYLNFFKEFFGLLNRPSTPATCMAFLNADFRDFQGIPAMNEDPDKAILMGDYMRLMETCGWRITHLIDCPLSTERFSAHMVKRMQDKKTLGVVRRFLIMATPKLR